MPFSRPPARKQAQAPRRQTASQAVGTLGSRDRRLDFPTVHSDQVSPDHARSGVLPSRSGFDRDSRARSRHICGAGRPSLVDALLERIPPILPVNPVRVVPNKPGSLVRRQYRFRTIDRPERRQCVWRRRPLPRHG
jgi:hypothetical protein